MLHNLLNQTAEIFNPTTDTTDDYGNEGESLTSVGTFPCRIEAWKPQEFEVDRDTRRSWYKAYFPEKVAAILTGESRIRLSTNSQMGVIPSSTESGLTDPLTDFEVFGSPQVFRSRTRITHVEAWVRTTEG